jgi:hypothetical protein
MKPLEWRMVCLREKDGTITHYLFYADDVSTAEGTGRFAQAVEALKNNKPLPKLYIGYNPLI